MAMERRIDGKVELQALVDETGRVAEVRVVNVSKRGLGFEEQAVRAAKARGYRPGTKDGVPVRVWVPIVVNFQISAR
jgi:TonB family protein